MRSILPSGLLTVLLFAPACAPDITVVESYSDPNTPDAPVSPDADNDGFTVEDGDCNDADPDINPDAIEICDGIDNDCSGTADDVTGNVWYYDADMDGYGSEVAVVDGCEIETEGPGQWIAMTGDCDDTNPNVNPSAIEICDGIDNDCEGTIDENATDASTWYTDGDGDGYGDASSSTASCEAPSGTVADSSDCNDHNPLVNPGQEEICDGIDNDCDDDVDEEVTTTFYADTDGDGYGDASNSTWACSVPEGYVADDSDCDDTDIDINPDGTEECNGEDDDCDGTVDEGVTNVFYADTDGDGYGDPASSADVCEAPDGYVEDDTDCDDANEYVHPDGIEVCDDTLDNDCDGDADSSPCVTEGDYEGNFVITLEETTYGLGSDNCEGDAYLTVDTMADPMISGYVECAFIGDASTYLSDTYVGTVEGNFAQDISTSGTIDWSTFGWTIDFDGIYDADHEVNLDFGDDDTYTVLGIPLNFSYEGYVHTDVVVP